MKEGDPWVPGAEGKEQVKVIARKGTSLGFGNRLSYNLTDSYMHGYVCL